MAETEMAGSGTEHGDVEGYRGPTVCKLIGITYRQLDYWARTGLLRPSVADARGSGSKRLYSYRDLLELKVIKQLLDADVSLQSARRAVDCLRQNLGVDLAAAKLVLTEGRSVLAQTNGEVVDLLAGGQGVFNIVPLSGVVDQLDAAIVELRGTREPSLPLGWRAAAHPAGTTAPADLTQARADAGGGMNYA
ncbi:MAG TPA: MerR family transcriptional regulator [Acidimicrobiales bacterium]|nr:MerR family transcriptional regulator [Acidimicrobiales bacterium]